MEDSDTRVGTGLGTRKIRLYRPFKASPSARLSFSPPQLDQ